MKPVQMHKQHCKTGAFLFNTFYLKLYIVFEDKISESDRSGIYAEYRAVQKLLPENNRLRLSN